MIVCCYSVTIYRYLSFEMIYLTNVFSFTRHKHKRYIVLFYSLLARTREILSAYQLVRPDVREDAALRRATELPDRIRRWICIGLRQFRDREFCVPDGSKRIFIYPLDRRKKRRYRRRKRESANPPCPSSGHRLTDTHLSPTSGR